MPKILYLAEWDAFSNSGVIRKIKAQYETWRKLGVEARLVIVSPKGPRGSSPTIQGEGITVIAHEGGRYGLGKLFKAGALREASKVVAEFGPDVIYYRQSSWTPGILGVLKKATCVVVEINSNDVFEIDQYGWLKARYHRATRGWLINLTKGFVCVGRELGEYYSRYGKPVEIIGNGFDTSSVVPRSPPHNARVQLVFVGSPNQSWHGVDKLVQVAEQFSDMDFHIVGESVENPPSNFILHGYLGWESLSALYKKMDFGFGTLALHRKKMNEISPLKSREYVAYGLPVIGAYQDTDLDGCDFFLRIPNTESGVRDSVSEIKKFVSVWKDKVLDVSAVNSKVDSVYKERRRVEFMESLLEKIES